MHSDFAKSEVAGTTLAKCAIADNTSPTWVFDLLDCYNMLRVSYVLRSVEFIYHDEAACADICHSQDQVIFCLNLTSDRLLLTSRFDRTALYTQNSRIHEFSVGNLLQESIVIAKKQALSRL